MKRSIILDTDIGSDVDDAMALAVLLGRADCDLIGVTTVYGDTVLRARLARRYAGLAGRAVPAYAGRRETLSGRDVWWAGHEGSLHDDLDHELVEPVDAVQFLIDTVAAHPGEIDVVAIGPLTNIGAALETDPAFAGNVRSLVIMGGSFGPGAGPEHNFGSDAVAAQRVFDSGLATVVTGLEITLRHSIGPEQVAQLTAAGPLGAAVGRDIDQWWSHGQERRNTPHDPVAVQSLFRPELFTLSAPGRIMVTSTGRMETDDDHAGASVFTPGDGLHRIVVDVDAEAVSEAIIADSIRADTVRADDPTRD